MENKSIYRKYYHKVKYQYTNFTLTDIIFMLLVSS
jgi:hypothetical protein